MTKATQTQNTDDQESSMTQAGSLNGLEQTQSLDPGSKSNPTDTEDIDLAEDEDVQDAALEKEEDDEDTTDFSEEEHNDE